MGRPWSSPCWGTRRSPTPLSCLPRRACTPSVGSSRDFEQSRANDRWRFGVDGQGHSASYIYAGGYAHTHSYPLHPSATADDLGPHQILRRLSPTPDKCHASSYDRSLPLPPLPLSRGWPLRPAHCEASSNSGCYASLDSSAADQRRPGCGLRVLPSGCPHGPSLPLLQFPRLLHCPQAHQLQHHRVRQR